MRAPTVYFGAHGGFGRYILLMEDMAPAACGDQVKGSTFAEARLALKTVAGLHARFFNKVGTSEETYDWPRRSHDPEYWNLVRDVYLKAAAVLTDERYEFFDLASEDFPIINELLDLFDSEKIDEINLERQNNFKEMNPDSQFSSTLIHGDFRADNIFFRDNDGHIKVLDYQTTREDHCAFDLAYFIYGSLTKETRKRHEMELIQFYFDEMRRLGTDLTMEELLLRYQRSLEACFFMIVIGQKDCMVEDNRAKLLIASMYERLEDTMADWNVVEAVKLRGEKMDERGVTSWYSHEELERTLPSHAFKLLCANPASLTTGLKN